MRLHRLEVTAFGPFPETVEVDLDALSDAGLFLLTGPTGAGKTSVLDAVCFALYGDVPGDRGSAKRLRADQAAPGVRPRVELELSVAGRRLRLVRTPAWEREKLRGTGTTTEQASVVLAERLPDGEWRTLSTRLDETGHLVGDLLGMTLTQFTQVAMLPQGRFQAFLRAKSEDRHKLLEWSNRTIGGSDPEYQDDGTGDDHGATYEAAMIEMAMYAHELTDRKRAEPADDLWTVLTTATVTLDDGTVTELTDLERDLFFTLLLVAGNETTRNAVSLGIMGFMDHPDQWERVTGGAGMDEAAVDEVLRYTSPVNYFRRTATEDTELGGQLIRAGDKVTLWYASGNRDEAVYEDPHRLDLTRTGNHHLAFGGGGAHFCLGASLARLELKVIFEALAARMPDIVATGPADRLRMSLVNGIKHLPVEFSPSEPVLTA